MSRRLASIQAAESGGPYAQLGSAGRAAVGIAIVALLIKACLAGAGVTLIDNSFAKLRLFKITDFVAAAFLLAVLAVFTLYLGGG